MGKYIAVTSSEEAGCKVGYDEGEYTRALIEHEVYDVCEAMNAKTNLAKPEAVLPLLGEAATSAITELERVIRIMVNQVRTNPRPDERIPTIELLIRARIDEIKKQGGFA